jgi:hypothetical protein
MHDEGAEKEWKNNNGEPHCEQAGLRVLTAIIFSFTSSRTAILFCQNFMRIKTITITTTQQFTLLVTLLYLFFYKSD